MKVRFCGTKHVNSGWASTDTFHSLHFSVFFFDLLLVLLGSGSFFEFDNRFHSIFEIEERLAGSDPSSLQATTWFLVCVWFILWWWTFNDTVTGFCHDVADFQGLSFEFSGAIGFVGFVCHKFRGVFQSKNLYKSQSSNKSVQQETWKRELYYTWQTESYNPSGYSMRYSFKIEKITQNRTNSIGFRSEMFRCMSFDFVPSFRMFQYLWTFNPYFFRLWGNKWCCKKVAMTHIDTQNTPYTTAFAPEDFYTIPFTTFYTKEFFYAKCLRHQIPFTPNTFQTRKLLRQTTWVATWEKNISFACSRQIFPSVLNVW